MSDTLTLLLPDPVRLRGGIAAAPALARLLGRADCVADRPGGESQLLRHIDLLPRRLPVAAITRTLDAEDAMHGAWLRADPVHLRADMVSGRLLAHGPALQLGADEAQALLKPLKPLFGDEGFPISAPVPDRWYLSLPTGTELPEFSTPEQALGDDLHAHLPAGDCGRRWRRLLSEAQVLLHNHPLNAARAAAGKPTINSVWFWGGGALPDRLLLAGNVWSDDPLLQGSAKLAGRDASTLAHLVDGQPGAGDLVDLRSLRDVAQLDAPWLPWAIEQLARPQIGSICFDFADGRQFVYRPSHRWRFWRRPLRGSEPRG